MLKKTRPRHGWKHYIANPLEAAVYSSSYETMLKHPSLIPMMLQARVLSPGLRPGHEVTPSPGQQTFHTAFQILDKDEDGKISEGEAYRLVAYYSVSSQV
jgi:hypothetical protein